MIINDNLELVFKNLTIDVNLDWRVVNDFYFLVLFTVSLAIAFVRTNSIVFSFLALLDSVYFILFTSEVFLRLLAYIIGRILFRKFCSLLVKPIEASIRPTFISLQG